MEDLMKSALLSKGKFGIAALVLSISALLSGCGGGGSSSYDPYYTAWYDVYGYVCGHGAPSPGCNFYSNGLKIIDIEDPYFRNNYYLQADNWFYYDSYGVLRNYVGWAWKSPNGILYNDFGTALNNTDGQGRDFSADVAQQEQNVVKSAGEFFAAKYGLDNDTALKAARVLKDWAYLGKDRARTEQDIADFTQRLYGLDFNKVKGALAEAQKGNKAGLQELVNETATNWSSTPETVTAILKTWYGSQMNQL
jgi:hypothetical protein